MKTLKAKAYSDKPLAICAHLDDSDISAPGTIEIVSARTGEVLFTFQIPES